MDQKQALIINARENSQLQTFNSDEFGQVRVIDKNGEPLFCLSDVCRALEIGNPSDVKKRLDDGVVSIEVIPDNMGRPQNTTFITEAGLYDVLLDSRKPKAKEFRKWLTGEVAVSIRKTGMYTSNNMSTADMLLVMAKAFKEQELRLQAHDNQILQVQADIKHLTSAHNGITLRHEIRDNKQQEQLDRHDVDIKELQTVVGDRGPAEEVKTLISDIVAFTAETDEPYSYQTAYNLFYDTLKEQTGIRIQTRISNLKRRMKDKGWSQTNINKISGLDAITADPMIWQKVRDVIDIIRGYLNEAQQ